MKKLSVLFLLVILCCTARHEYESPLGLWTRPHPNQPDLPYDTLAYRALYKGDPDAKKLLAERDAKLKQQAEQKFVVASRIFHSNFESVWEAIIEILAQTDMGIQALDKNSGFIQTADFRLRRKVVPKKATYLIMTNGDSVATVPHGMFHTVYEGKAHLNLTIGRIGEDSTELKIHPHIVAFKSKSILVGHVESNVSCTSNGYLESMIFRLLDEKLQENSNVR